MAPGAMMGVAAGIGAVKSLVGLFKGIREKRRAANRPPPKMTPQAPKMATPAESGALALTGQNPVAQQGMQTTLPTIIQPAAQATGQLKRGAADNSLDNAKRSFLFQAAMNGDRL